MRPARWRHPLPWLLAAHTFLLVLLAVAYPVWRAADEPAHVDMARGPGREWSWPQIGDRTISRQVDESQERVGIVNRSVGTSPPLARPAPPRPPFADIAPDEGSGRTQQMAQHPPLYYVLLGRAGALLLPGDLAFDTEVVGLRLLSALLLVPVPLLAWLAARRVLDERGAVVAAVLAVAVPQLSHLGASVNNDTLLVLLVSAMVPLAVRLARGEGSTGLAVALGAVAGLASLTKGFGFALPLWLVVVCVAGRTDAVQRTAAAFAAWFAVGGWWIVRNVVVEGAVQPSAFGYPDPPPGFTFDLWWWLRFFWHRFTQRYWFEQDAIPSGAPPVAEVLFVGLAGLVVAGAVVLWRRADWPATVALVTPVVVLFGLSFAVALNYYRLILQPWAISGRYAFPAVVAVSVLAAAAVGSGRWAPLAAVGAAVALHGLATYWALDRYWEGLGALRAWSPLPWALVVLAAAGLAVSTAGLVVTAAGRWDAAAEPG